VVDRALTRKIRKMNVEVETERRSQNVKRAIEILIRESASYVLSSPYVEKLNEIIDDLERLEQEEQARLKEESRPSPPKEAILTCAADIEMKPRYSRRAGDKKPGDKR